MNNFTTGLRQKNMRRRSSTPLTVKKPHDIIPPLGEGNIRIIPLGGVEEIGRNDEYKCVPATGVIFLRRCTADGEKRIPVL